jgi:hypothetical protein
MGKQKARIFPVRVIFALIAGFCDKLSVLNLSKEVVLLAAI